MGNFICNIMLFFTGVTLPLSFVQLWAFGPFGVTPNKVSTAGLLLVALVLGVIERRPMPRNPKGWWVAAFSGSMLIGTTITLGRGAALDRMFVVVTILAAVVVFYFLLIYVARRRTELNILYWGLILGVSLSALSVLMQWGLVKAERTGGFSGDPNNFAFVTSMTLPIMGYYFSTTRSLMVKLLLAGFAVLCLVAIAASLSRTGIVALGVMSLMWMTRFRRFDVLRFAVPIGALLVVTIFVASPAWRERMTALTDRRAAAADGSIQKRVLQNVLAVEAFATNPVLGVGYKQFGTWAGGRINRGTAIHNSYLHVAAELGALGLIAYLGLIGATYIEYGRAWRLCRAMRARADPELEKLYLLAVYLQISLLGAVVGNLFLNSLRYRVSWMLYASSVVVLMLVRERVKELTADDPVPTFDSGFYGDAPVMGAGPNQAARA